MLLPYDAFLFMMIQQWLANSMDVATGSYTHMAGSFHIYEDEIPRAEIASSADAAATSLGRIASADRYFNTLGEFEKAIRDAVVRRDTRHIVHQANRAMTAISVKPSFQEVARLVLLEHACARLNLPEAHALKKQCQTALASQLSSKR
jgi:hypothetical protein